MRQIGRTSTGREPEESGTIASTTDASRYGCHCYPLAFFPSTTYYGDPQDADLSLCIQGRRDLLRGRVEQFCGNTHLNPTLKFYNEELFIYKCCYILYIFYKQFFEQIQVIFFRTHNSLSRGKDSMKVENL